MQGSRFVAAARTWRFILGRASARMTPAIAVTSFALALPVCARAATGIGPAPDCCCGHVMQYSYDGPTATATGSDTHDSAQLAVAQGDYPICVGLSAEKLRLAGDVQLGQSTATQNPCNE
jgi:hypothetical protein